MTGFVRISILTAAGLACLGLSACANKQNQDQLVGAALPDEFRVIAQKPLFIPPEYALRPPTPGKPSPQELQPESAARTALLGQTFDPKASQGERLFLAKVGADAANANIKAVIDDEFGDVSHKPKSFADKVLFWRHGDSTSAVAAATGANNATPVDAAAEKRRIEALTGGKDITIVRTPPPKEQRKLKLPGL